jgi:hypothetical protein
MFNLNRNKMKKVMFALCVMLGGSVAMVTAQDTQDTTSNQYRTESQTQPGQDQNVQGQDQNNQDMQAQDQNRERIQSTELPDGVKRSLEGQEYRGWLVNGAFKATASSDASMESDSTSQQGDNNAIGAQGQEIYIVELKNGAETKTVRFDKDGKKLEGMDEGQGNDQSSQSPDQSSQSQSPDQSSPSTTPDQSSQSTTPDQSSQSTTPDQSSKSTTTPDQSTQSSDQSTTHDPNKKKDEK